MIDWISTNKEWLFSGIGVAIVTLLWAYFRSVKESPSSTNTAQTTNTQTVNVITNDGYSQGLKSNSPIPQRPEEARLKESTKILFVDDDKSFKIVSLLRKSGWKNVEIVTDIRRLDADNVRLADIVFLDIQGVGKAMGFQDEGLGLARAIRDTYPEKKIVIYSAVSAHDPFAQGFRAANDRLSKNAEPYEFQKSIIDLMS